MSVDNVIEKLERRIAWYRTRLRNLKRLHADTQTDLRTVLARWAAVRDVAVKIHELRMKTDIDAKYFRERALLDELEKAAGLR